VTGWRKQGAHPLEGLLGPVLLDEAHRHHDHDGKSDGRWKIKSKAQSNRCY
jgi:hypothetical protein